MNMRPEDLAHLSPEDKRALLVKLMKKQQKSRSQPENSPLMAGGLDHLAVNVTELETQAVLDPAIRFESSSFEKILQPAHIFLTGATGFLGAFLLHELLEQTNADIYCLVRCASVVEGQNRIMQNLASYFPNDRHTASRILPVPGDLAQPFLGLSASQFHQLAEKVESIYHGGALVNWVYPFERLKPTNVQGTQEVLRLASQGKPKPLHFISSISVFPLFSDEESKIIYEADNLDHGGVLYSGYAQSKWVSEKLVTLAKNKGLPVAIYRPGLITGHSQTGAWNTDDVTCNLIKSWVELGYAPELEAATDMTPVDYVSKAIVHLSKIPQSLGQVFHLVNPQAVYMKEMVTWIRSYGFSIKTMPYERWRDMLIRHARDFRHASALSVVPLFSIDISESITSAELQRQETLDGLGALIVSQYADHSVRFDNRNATLALANASITCPPIDDHIFGNYLSFFINSGFMQAPHLEG